MSDIEKLENENKMLRQLLNDYKALSDNQSDLLSDAASDLENSLGSNCNSSICLCISQGRNCDSSCTWHKDKEFEDLYSKKQKLDKKALKEGIK